MRLPQALPFIVVVLLLVTLFAGLVTLPTAAHFGSSYLPSLWMRTTRNPPTTTGSWIPPTQQATSLTLSATKVAAGTYTFSGSLGMLVTGSPVANAKVYLHVHSSAARTWEIFSMRAGQTNPTTTSSAGTYGWTNIKLASGTYYFRTFYPGDATHLQSFAPSVQGVQVTV